MFYRIRECLWVGALMLNIAGPAIAQDPDVGTDVEGPSREKPAYKKAVSKGIESLQGSIETSARLWVDHSTWPSAWRLRSDHFEVRTTRPKKFGFEVLRGVETMYQWFLYILDMPLREGDYIPIEIQPSIPAYNARAGTAGHHSSKYGCFVLRGEPTQPVITYYSKDETGGRRFITHGALSAYLARVSPITPPLWIDEGLSCYFEMHWDFPNVITAWRAMLDRNGFIPLATLMNATIADYTDDHFRQLGMLVYYLLYEREDTRIQKDPDTGEVASAPFREYLRTVLRGNNPPADDPVQRLLNENLETLEADFRAHSFGRTPRW